MKVLKKNKVEIGAFRVPTRRKPALGVQVDNFCSVYGYFQNEKAADEFMEQLAKFVGAAPDVESAESKCGDTNA